MNPIRTLVLTLALLAATAAAQKTIYFYPPDDAKWIAGRSYTSDLVGTPKPLELDTRAGRCGWYKITTNQQFIQFWLGSKGTDIIGPNGRLATDFETTPSAIDIGGFEVSAMSGGTLYFIADELDPNVPGSGWQTTDPGVDFDDQGRCEFKLAAFVYDTDKTVNSSFSYYKDDIGCGGDQYGAWTAGILKNMVKKNLNPTTKKMECDECTKPGGFESVGDFEDAFKDFNKGNKSAKNVKLCYDMPFKQVTSGSAKGSFEFDSDRMLNSNGKTLGGFFPEFLNKDAMSTAAVVAGSSDYDDCPKCRERSKAESYVNLTKKINPWCFERGFQTKKATGEDMANCGDPYGEVSGGPNGNNGKPAIGHFAHGGWPADTWGMTTLANSNQGEQADWNKDWRDTTMNLWDSSDGCGKKGASENEKACMANQGFCFESHAEFTYDPTQEFFFRGDDDIWVFINNKLVIDLGGAHLAAPGYVQLNTLGLTDGETYPIDIFFCDRRSGMSNVRISTNMYVAQKSNFYADPTGNLNYMCVLYRGGADCSSKMSGGSTSGGEDDWCGQDLIDNKFKVDFFVVNKVDKEDTLWLSPKPSYASSKGKQGQCTSDGNGNYTCYGGIKIEKNGAAYSCGGKKACRGDATATGKVSLTGSYNVYARLVGTDGKPDPSSKSILIDSFKSATKTNIVWGKLEGEAEIDGKKVEVTLKDSYGDMTKQNQRIIAGKRTPVYISVGNWEDENKFIFDNDPDRGISEYSLTVIPANKLQLYAHEDGDERKSSGRLPASGYDTVWVEGGFDLEEEEMEFSLNVVAEAPDAPSMKLVVYQPKLRFVEKSGGVITDPSGFTRWANNGKAPFVGSALDMHIEAYDPERKDAKGNNELCTHCSFTLGESSSTGNCDASVSKSGIALAGTTIKLSGGKADIDISGREATNPLETCKVTWKTFSKENNKISLEWTELQFRDAPVPVPSRSFAFDRNGDGIGDSLVIEYNKSLKNEDKGDSLLPVLLEVAWEKGTVLYFHLPGHSVEDLKKAEYIDKQFKDPNFFKANREYWEGKIKNDTMIVIAEDDLKLSKDILTYRTVGEFSTYVSSRIPYYENGVQLAAISSSLLDRISPIVVAAEYEYSDKNCVVDATNKCNEVIKVTLSERVSKPENVPDEDADAYRNPFEYCLGSQGNNCPKFMDEADRFNVRWNDHLSWSWELPSGENIANIARYNNSGTISSNGGLSQGDSIVYLTYKSYRPGVSLNPTPKPDDWVKIRIPNGGGIFADAEGNVAKREERGVMITGSKPSTMVVIKITEVSGPDAPPLNGIFTENTPCPGNVDCGPHWMDMNDGDVKNSIKDLFTGDRIAEILPVVSVHPDSVRTYYPGSVGAIFEVSSDLNKEINNILSVDCKDKDCKGVDGMPLTGANIAKGLKVNASAYYHTNLGDYTAHRDNFSVPCDDPIFKKNGKGDCYSNGFNFYLPWDMKANNGRSVGAGAYVGITKFYIQFTWTEDGNTKTRKIVPKEFIEMYGARRKAK